MSKKKTYAFAAALIFSTQAFAPPAGAQLSAGHDLCEYNIIAQTDGARLGGMRIFGTPGTPEAMECWNLASGQGGQAQWPNEGFVMSMMVTDGNPVPGVITHEIGHCLGFTSERFTAETAPLPEEIGAEDLFYSVSRCAPQAGCAKVAYLWAQNATDAANSRLVWFATEGLGDDDMIHTEGDEFLKFDVKSGPPASNLQYPVIVQDAL